MPDWIVKFSPYFFATALVGTAVAFLLRRVFGEAKSEKFLALEQSHPRVAAAVTLADGIFTGLGEVSGALYRLFTGKAPPLLVLPSTEELPTLDEKLPKNLQNERAR